ncbi:MAG TPA: hypothetical protein VJH55_00580 [Candidatus Paceibacterota bacterium]
MKKKISKKEMSSEEKFMDLPLDRQLENLKKRIGALEEKVGLSSDPSRKL